MKELNEVLYVFSGGTHWNAVQTPPRKLKKKKKNSRNNLKETVLF